MRFFRIALLLIIFFCSVFFPGWAYRETSDKWGLLTRADGFMITRNDEKLLVLRQVCPEGSAEFQNAGHKGVFRVKITNTGAEIYNYSVEGGRITSRGVNWVMAEISVPKGETRRLKVSPPMEGPGKFTFAVLGDTRTGTHIHKRAQKMIAATKAVFVMNMGDIVNHGTEREYQGYMREFDDFGLPVFVAIGNHERAARGGFDRFAKYVNPYDYSFKVGGFNFIILDNSSGYIGPARFARLEQQISSEKNNFVFMHMPPSCPYRQFDDHLMHSREERARFISLMKKYGARAVFMGHVHGYSKEVIGGVVYIISACAGAFPYMSPNAGGFYNFVLVKVDGDSFTTEVVRINPLKL